MKKIVSLALAILMVACLASVFASADVDPEIGVNRAVSIYETETAPVVDGVVIRLPHRSLAHRQHHAVQGRLRKEHRRQDLYVL